MQALEILAKLIPTFALLEVTAFLFIIIFLRFLTPINWFKALYNEKSINNKDIPNHIAVRIVQATIIGVHIFLGLLVLGTFFVV